MVIPTQAVDPAVSDRASAVRGVVIAVAVSLPAFLAGALAVQLQRDLEFGSAALGGLAGAYFMASAVGSPVMGRLVERLGSSHSAGLAVTVTGLALLSGGWVQSWSQLMLAFALAGFANSIGQPTANLLISDAIPVRRLALAFGIKQSCVPAAAFLGGVAVPVVVVQAGWRWVFWGAGCVAICYGAWLWLRREGRLPPAGHRATLRDSEAPITSLLLLTVGGFLGAAATTSMGAFLVDAAVFNGYSPSTAGWIYAGLALGTITSRIALGWSVDRSPTRSRFVIITLLLLVGSLGHVLMALGGGQPFIVGAVVGFVVGWAWTGLVHYAVVTWYRRTPAAATGFVQGGLSLGAGIGPLVFGQAVAAWGYSVAWSGSGLVSFLAALTVFGARWHLRATRRRSRTAEHPSRPG